MGTIPAIPDRRHDNADIELETLCRKIRTVDGAEARDLPAQILIYLAQSLACMDIDIYVEECLPTVCNASHALVRAMGTFRPRNADSGLVESARVRLIQALETIADEVQTCKTRSKPVPLAKCQGDKLQFRDVR